MTAEKDQMQKISQFCRQHPEIIAAYLFGSRAVGKAGALSDLDLAFLIDYSLIRNKYRYGYHAYLVSELINLLSTNDVDVVILNEAPPFLKFQVINRGKVIFCRSEREKLAFHVKAFNEYQDFRPFIAVQNYYMVNRLKNPEGGYGDRQGNDP